MDKIEKRDVQFGTEMAWHNKTQVREVITKDEVFPWHVVLAEANYVVEVPQFDTTVTPPAPLPAVLENRKHKKYVLPLASDDLLPLGTGQYVNLDTYTVQTPHDVWKVRDKICEGIPNTVVSAGSVMNRGRFFISTKLDEIDRLTLSDGSQVELLLNSIGSLDKSLTEQYSLSSTRIVCYNTLMVSFLTDSVKWRFRHGKNMKTDLEGEEGFLAGALEAASTVGNAFNTLINNPITRERAEEIYTGLIVSPGQEKVSQRARNMIDEHMGCFSHGKGNIGRTEFDLLNGWTDPKTHGYQESSKDTFSTFESSEFGDYANQKVRLAIFLLKKREELEKIARRGRDLLDGKVIVQNIIPDAPATDTPAA
jgi:hypothetical protein